MKTVLYWAPRVLGILGILYIGMFSLDVFEAGTPVLHMLLGFAIHSIPSLALVLFLVLAWKYERVGGALFFVAFLAPFLFLSNALWVNALLGAPFLLIGALFLASSYYSSDSTESNTESA